MGIALSIFGMVGKWAIFRAVQAWWRQMTSRPIFYPNRAVLNRESPLADKLKKSASVDAMWLTGAKASIEITEFNKIRRLLLPDPQSTSLEYFRSAMYDPRDLASEIRKTTESAIRKGVKVRWLTEFLGYTMTIGNAAGENSWLQIEIALPTIHGAERPSIEFTRSKHEPTIKQAFTIFEALWENDNLSREPNESEYGDGTR